MARSDPVMAAKLAASVPAGDMRRNMEFCVALRWAIVDPEAAAQWMQSLPTARERDDATAAFIQTIAQVDPIRGSEWVLQINDPERRKREAQIVIDGGLSKMSPRQGPGCRV